MKKMKQQETIRQILECSYLLVLIAFISQEFLEFTMFPVNWKEPFGTWVLLNGIYAWLFESPQHILAILLILRLIFLEKYEWKYLILSAAILWCAHYAWMENHSVNVLLLALLIVGAKDIPFRKIVCAHMLALVFLLLITMGAVAIGLIENVVYAQEERLITRYAFGMTYPTNYAAYLFYLSLDYWYWRGENLKWLDICFAGLLGIFVLLFCGARCSAICFGLMVIAMILYKKKLGKKVLAVFLSGSVTIAAAGWTALTMLYSYQKLYMVKLDSLFSNRLNLGRKGIDIYGFQAWGRAISMNGNGEGEYASKYFFLDSSYLQCGIMYGLVILGLVLLAFFVIGNQARRDHEWVLLWILALIAVHSTMEQHLLEISSCIYILAVFADRRLVLCGVKEQSRGFSQQA